MRVYTYVIRYDGGSAPNYERPFTTLAVCKPDIRRCSEKGNCILAFASATLSTEPHAVRWAGIIRDKLPFADYWRDTRFQDKKPTKSATPDNIYKPVGPELHQVPNCTHNKRNRSGDLRGQFVLVLDPVWRFGPTAPILLLEFGLRMIEARRKHRVHDMSDMQWTRLVRWLDAQPQVGASPRHARHPPRTERSGTKRTLSKAVRCDR
jgi:hypothetical protein